MEDASCSFGEGAGAHGFHAGRGGGEAGVRDVDANAFGSEFGGELRSERVERSLRDGVAGGSGTGGESEGRLDVRAGAASDVDDAVSSQSAKAAALLTRTSRWTSPTVMANAAMLSGSVTSS
jgi:hypothetical protein